MQIYYNHHYITVDAKGLIIDGWSDGPHHDRDTSGAICINAEGGYQFRLYPGGQENPPMYTMDGIPMYRWDGEQAVARSEAEIASDRAAIPGPPAPDVPLLLRAGVSKLDGHNNSFRRSTDGLVVVSVAVNSTGYVADLPDGYRPSSVVSSGGITICPDGSIFADESGVGTVCFYLSAT